MAIIKPQTAARTARPWRFAGTWGGVYGAYI